MGGDIVGERPLRYKEIEQTMPAPRHFRNVTTIRRFCSVNPFDADARHMITDGSLRWTAGPGNR